MIETVNEIGLADIEAPPDGRLIPLDLDAAAPRVPELIQLFHAVSSLNANHQAYILQFVGSVRGEGVSTIASSFVEIAAAQQGDPVLLIDCSPGAEPVAGVLSLIDAFRETGSVIAAIQAAPGRPGIGLARLSTAKDARLNVNAANLSALLKIAKQSFPVVVLDCPPVSLVPESLALARFCDGTVLVVEAETTSRKTIAETKQALERFDGQIIGVVLNQCKTYIPHWLNQLL
jgi:Mrp family chromosome partitioning ATPase